MGGEILKKEFKIKDIKFFEKTPKDYVSEVDYKVEDIIRSYLNKNFPDIPFLGEETGKGELEYGFICDPLDGTRNFLQRIPFFSISLCFVKDREPFIGVIYIPMLGELFWGIKGRGAFLNGERIKVSEKKKEDGLIIGTGFPFRKREYWKPYYESFKIIFEMVDDLRRPGSASQDLAYTACGRYDGFFEFGLSPWDVMAGVLLVEEAGGVTGDPYGGRSHLKTGNIIAGNPFVFDFLLEIIKNKGSNP